MVTLLQKIKSGAFSRSRYFDLIEKERASLRKRIEWAKANYLENSFSLNEIIQRETLRYETKKRQYLEKAHYQEIKTLDLFRKELLKEFEVDLWDEVFLNHAPETELEVYYLYKKLGNFEITVSEIYAKLNKKQ